MDRLPDWPALAEVGGSYRGSAGQKTMLLQILGYQCMGRGGDDALDLQGLFQGVEERLDLPAFLVNHGNRVGLRPVYVVKKNQGFAGSSRSASMRYRTCGRVSQAP